MIIEIDGNSIHYEKIGSGEPLLLIHGLNIGSGQWYNNMDAFAKHFTVYAPDLPGAGKSSKIDFVKSDIGTIFLNAVKKFIQRLEIGKVNILGHSLGGWLAMRLALSGEQVKKMVLVNSMGFTDFVPWRYKLLSLEKAAKFLARTAMRPTRRNMSDFLKSVMHKKHANEEFVEDFYKNVANDRRAHPFFLIHRLLKNFKVRPQFYIENELAEIKTPILIAAGKYDPLIPFDEVKGKFGLIPGSRVRIFDKSGHVPFIEEPDEFNGAVIDFLLDR